MSNLYDYLRLGATVTNRHTDLNEVFRAWPKDRSVVLRVCRPHREVEALIKHWIKKYANGLFKDGAVAEEPFSMWLETQTEKFQIMVEPGQKMENPTAELFVAEPLFWRIAARDTDLTSAYLTSKQIYIRSRVEQDLRDLAHIDNILGLILDTLIAKNINLADIVLG